VNSKHDLLSLLAAIALLSTQLPALANDLPLYCKHRPERGLRPEQEARCAGDPIKAQEAKKKAEELQAPSYPFSRAGFLTVEPTSSGRLFWIPSQASGNGRQLSSNRPRH
jgi:hypothetical protein